MKLDCNFAVVDIIVVKKKELISFGGFRFEKTLSSPFWKFQF